MAKILKFVNIALILYINVFLVSTIAPDGGNDKAVPADDESAALRMLREKSPAAILESVYLAVSIFCIFWSCRAAGSDSGVETPRYDSEVNRTVPDFVNCPSMNSVYHVDKGQTERRITWSSPTIADTDNRQLWSVPRKVLPAQDSGDNFREGTYYISYISMDNTPQQNLASCPTEKFKVVVTKCEKPPKPAHGNIECSGSFLYPIYGDICKFTCNPGHHLNLPNIEVQVCESFLRDDGQGYMSPGYEGVKCVVDGEHEEHSQVTTEMPNTERKKRSVEVQPDPCEENKCNHGSSCIASGTTYTCVCPERKTGLFCELDIVDGGWGPLIEMTSCSVTCGEGIKTAIRQCDSPVPENGGLYCTGESKLIISCKEEQCPECPEFHLHKSMEVECQNVDGELQQCDLRCPDNKIITMGSPSTFYCGLNTGYSWMPELRFAELPKCVAIEKANAVKMEIRFGYNNIHDSVSDDDQSSLKHRIEENIKSAFCVKKSTCKSRVVTQVNTLATGDRRKRSVSYQLQVAVIADLDTMDMDILTYQENMIRLGEMIINLENASKEGELDISIHGTEYKMDREHVDLFRELFCPPGMAEMGIYCGNCLPGNYEDGGKCLPCNYGFYQPMEGRGSCISCPMGLTTKFTGSVNADACVEHI